MQVLAKAEWFNPGGSIKDRPALNILRTALADGSLSEGKRLLDSTSGNMGISYATFGAALGIPVTLTLPANASRERIAILRALGAELVLTDPLEGSDGAIRVARQMAAEMPERYLLRQPVRQPGQLAGAFPEHRTRDLPADRRVRDAFRRRAGDFRHADGVARYLRACNPQVQMVAVQPDAAFHGLEGLKHMATAIQPGIYDPGLPDRTLEVSTEEAHAMVRRLAREEGLFVGISSGAAAVAALRVAQELEEGVVVTVFPDAGYKYLSDTSFVGVR